MASGAEHYAAAEELLDLALSSGNSHAEELREQATVHATLALAAATVDAALYPVSGEFPARAWLRATASNTPTETPPKG